MLQQSQIVQRTHLVPMASRRPDCHLGDEVFTGDHLDVLVSADIEGSRCHL